MKMKQILTAALAASLALLALAGCGGKTASSGEAAAKDYAQIIHDARDEEMNDSLMIIAPDAEGGFTALGGGATMSLRLDSLGKSMGSAVMRMKIHVEDGEL